MERDTLSEHNTLLSPIESPPREHNQILSARLRALETATSDLCWITTNTGYFLTDQASWEGFTGQSPVQAMGKGWLEAVHPGDRKLLEITRTQCVQAKQPFSIVCLVQGIEGSYRSLSIRCVPVLNETDHVSEVMYLGTLVMSGWQSAEKSLRRPGMEQLESLLINMAHDAIVVTDHSGHILSWNQGATNLYGYSAEEAVGQRSLDLLQPHSSQSSLEEFAHALMQNGKWEGELMHRCRDGHIVTVEVRIVVMRSEDGRPLAVLEVSRDITARKRTEQLLQEYIQIAETAGEIGLWAWDLVQKKSIFPLLDKRVFSTLPDYEPDQPISYEQFLQVVHPDDRAATKNALREAMEQKTDYINEFRVINPNQGVIWYMAYGRTIYDEHEKPARMVGIVVNITERKHSEQALLEANEQITAIIESITDAFIYFNKDWRYIYVNSQACRCLGRSRDELLGNVIWEVQPDLCDTIVERKFRETMDERKGTMFDAFCQPTKSWLAMRTYPAKEGITVFITDITQRVKIEKALRKSEAKFRRLVEANISGVLVGDAAGRVSEANDAFLKLIGATREELEHGEINWRELTPPEYYLADQHALEELRETGACQPFEKEYVTRQAKHIPVLITGTSLEGNINKHILFVIDLTRQKELEKQREHFLHLVSHELRTPLTAINGSLQLAHRRLLRAKQSVASQAPGSEEVFNKVEETLLQSLRQTHVLNRLTDDLVESARITSEKLSLTLQPRNLVEIVQGTVEDMRFTVPERSILLEDIPQEARVLVDAERIIQVLSNFISNALKYSPHEKQVVVGITLDDQEVRVWVRDWGAGLSSEEQQRIWQRYFQGRGLQDRDIKSVNLGLGLYLCKMLIQQHNGHIGVESQLGEGSTFWFTLPRYISEDH